MCLASLLSDKVVFKTVSERSRWSEIQDQRMAEPGAAQAYRAAAVALDANLVVQIVPRVHVV